MSLEIGIVGLPNVGKSTLFNALTQAGAAVAGYPFTTIEPNVGVVPVADARLDEIARIVGPQEVVPTTVRFVDIAGLVRGAHRGEGLGNQFLGHIRSVDAIAMVVRCFRAADVPHVAADLDPIDDLATVETELILADLATVQRRLEKVRPSAKAHPREYGAELALLEKLVVHLDSGALVRQMDRSDLSSEQLREMSLLTAKPAMYVANISEGDMPAGGPLAAKVADRAAAQDIPAVAICARLEMELAELPRDEAADLRTEMGVGEPGLQRLVAASYGLLDLVTYFTTAGNIVQAWTVRRNTPAPRAAGKIHTDMERGFIRAEVVHYDDLVSAGSLNHARETGHLRLEGRDYVIQDGDVVHYRFAV